MFKSMTQATPLWIPSPEQLDSAALTGWIEDFGGSYEELHQWSVRDPGAFWSTVWDRFAVVGLRGSATVEQRSGAAGFDLRNTRFFPDARLCYAENLLHGRGTDEHCEAVVAINESGVRVALSWAELRSEVGAVAAALRAEGLGVGDRIALWLPAGVHALVLLLAANTIGAVSSTVSPDFGEVGALDRFGQSDPLGPLGRQRGSR